jgi:hypothetical protein
MSRFVFPAPDRKPPAARFDKGDPACGQKSFPADAVEFRSHPAPRKKPAPPDA